MSTRVVRKGTSSGGGDTTTSVPFSVVGAAVRPTIATSATQFAYGAWVQLTANIGSDANGYGAMHIVADTPNTLSEMLLDIGTGASGSEVVLVTVRLPANAIGGFVVPLTVLPVIASGARVAARAARIDAAGAENTHADVIAVPL